MALFSKRGYYGTSMGDIADAAGLVKASLYSHYAGKDELFLSVAQDYMQDFTLLNDRLFEASQSMDIPDRLYYIFKEYILHYLRNPVWINFAMQSVRFVPDELIVRFFPKYQTLVNDYGQMLMNIFSNGIQQGIIRPEDPSKMVWSLKITRDGVLAWMVVQQLGEEYIETFWNIHWLGMAVHNHERGLC